MKASTHIEAVDLPGALKERLHAVTTRGKVAHLWVFISPDVHTATSIGRAFLLDWLQVPGHISEHPDLLEVKTSGKAGVHSIAAIRRMLDVLALAPHGSKGRAVLIDAADRMLPPTANALLKALEEPPPSTVIVLATASPHLILPTILSRAQTIRFPGHRTGGIEELSPLLELLERGTPVAYSSLMKACEAMEKALESEQQELARQMNDTTKTVDLSAVAKQEAALETEAGLVLWLQHRAKKTLEDLYLYFRDHGCSHGAAVSEDPTKLTELLLQAMNGIDRGADLSTMMMWFVSQAYTA